MKLYAQKTTDGNGAVTLRTSSGMIIDDIWHVIGTPVNEYSYEPFTGMCVRGTDRGFWFKGDPTSGQGVDAVYSE